MSDVGDEPFGWTNDPSVVMVCLTFVRDASLDEIFRVLAAQPFGTVATPFSLGDLTNSTNSGIRIAQDGQWAVVVELESLAATKSEILAALSRGREVVQVFRTGSGMENFSYWRDGEQWCQFDPINPSVRTGSRPDSLVAEMRACGISPDGGAMVEGTGLYRLAATLTGLVADTALVLDAALPAGSIPRRRRRQLPDGP
ncbi:DUF6461 domain-containing protein [Amycolatopsis nivea]|uniref:DUF6461 domain-containing protein n=1 Tax=Amycolatopsis nivea TaxID=1644109 RepID=UPI00106F6A20|nr:DUF6461 domain-containing protein [Amycolatopsis nivea]